MAITTSKPISLIWRLTNCLSETLLPCGNGNDEADIFRFLGKIHQCTDRMADISSSTLTGE
ncbi:Uncharacterised protein [Shigella sonnei]|nr:Uncharacterised protein [Shigella sonnei]SRN41979.1 Uncharacterised protein [Shigella flexneri]